MTTTLRLQATSDVSPAANRERGFATPAYPFIPGGALRGALAALWIRRNGRPESDPDRFAAQVLGLRIGPGRALGSAQRPLSVFACKYPQTAACGRSFDAAFGEVPPDRRCPGCGRPLEGSKGEWAGVRRRTRTRTALGADGTVRDGSLFARESLASGQTFEAPVQGDTTWLTGPFSLRVGGERSTAGAMRAAIVPAAEPSLPPPGADLVVRLLSPAVFLAPDGRTALFPQVGDLERALRGTDAPASDITVAGHWVRTETFGGWNAAGGLPKSTEVVVASAATFVLRMPAGQVWTEEWMRVLCARGLGVRRADGLGWIEPAPAPWRPAQASAARSGRAPAEESIRSAAQALTLSGESGLVKQVIGWLAEGYTDVLHPPGYAYDGLPNADRDRVDRALAVSGEGDRRALIVALTARYHRMSSEKRTGSAR